jgi:hypothetical protein
LSLRESQYLKGLLMTLLQGIVAPQGSGIILEVHLDIQKASSSFLKHLQIYGFENDPFEVFYPLGYENHMTGRIRIETSKLYTLLPRIRAVIYTIITEAQHNRVDLYAEIELVREKHSFSAPIRENRAWLHSLESFNICGTGLFGKAKADIHLKFWTGNVSEQVYNYFLAKNFYWVKVPQTATSLGKEVATLQSSKLSDAQDIYAALLLNPPPACIGIQLEQKITMLATRSDIPLPEVMEMN